MPMRRSAEQRAQDQRQPRGVPHVVSAPVGGLNYRDALAAMPETDATILDNMTCQPTWVEFRGGSTTLAKFTGYAETLMAYNGVSSQTSALYAACTNGTTRSIYRVDNVAGGNVGAAVVGGVSNTVQQITNSNYDYNQFGTGSANVLILLNGADAPLIFDGTSWTYVASSGTTYTWTGGPASLSSLRYSAVYKQRLWFVQAGTMNVYYLPQTDFAGAMTLLNMGDNFTLGGYLVAIISVSIDNSAGTNDYIAFVSNLGEIVMFQGYDPSSASTWSMAARFRVGTPIGTGRNCWQKVGMDAMLLTTDGLILLSEAMLTDRAQGERYTVTDKIRYGIVQAIQSYQANLGWQILLYPLGKKLVLNVPTTASRSQSYQFVQSQINGSWSTWGLLASPLNAFCWENWNNALYEGTTGAIKQADVAGGADDGQPFTIAIRPAYNYMGDPTKQKIYKQVLVQISTNGNLSLALSTSVDFNETQPTGSVPLSSNTLSMWGSAMWNVAPWSDAQQVVKKWLGMQGEGYCAAPYLQASVAGITGKLQSLTYVYEPGSVFYG